MIYNTQSPELFKNSCIAEFGSLLNDSDPISAQQESNYHKKIILSKIGEPLLRLVENSVFDARLYDRYRRCIYKNETARSMKKDPNFFPEILSKPCAIEQTLVMMEETKFGFVDENCNFVHIHAWPMYLIRDRTNLSLMMSCPDSGDNVASMTELASGLIIATKATLIDALSEAKIMEQEDIRQISEMSRIMGNLDGSVRRKNPHFVTGVTRRHGWDPESGSGITREYRV